MATLCVRLPLDLPSPGAMLDYALSAEGQTVQQQGSLAWSQWPAMAPKSQDLTLVLPMSALAWHRVTLPPGSLPRAWTAPQASARLRAILEGVLEERLLEEPANVHLALQPSPSGVSQPWVVACDKAWLKAWVDALSQSQQALKRIVPELTPAQLQQGLYVQGDADQAKLACLLDSPDAGPAIVHAPLGSSIQTLLASDPFWKERRLLAEPAVAALAEQAIGQEVILQQRGERLLQALQSDWELAQFDMAQAIGRRHLPGVQRALMHGLRGRQWRAARWSVVALVLVNLVGLNAWALHIQNSQRLQRQQLSAMLRQTFPDVAVVIDAPLQMERELERLRRNRGVATGQSMGEMLGRFAQSAPKAYRVQSIDFLAGELKLTAAELGPEVRQRLIDDLRSQDIQARWQSGQWVLRAESRK